MRVTELGSPLELMSFIPNLKAYLEFRSKHSLRLKVTNECLLQTFVQASYTWKPSMHCIVGFIQVMLPTSLHLYWGSPRLPTLFTPWRKLSSHWHVRRNFEIELHHCHFECWTPTFKLHLHNILSFFISKIQFEFTHSIVPKLEYIWFYPSKPKFT